MHQSNSSASLSVSVNHNFTRIQRITNDYLRALNFLRRLSQEKLEKTPTRHRLIRQKRFSTLTAVETTIDLIDQFKFEDAISYGRNNNLRQMFEQLAWLAPEHLAFHYRFVEFGKAVAK